MQKTKKKGRIIKIMNEKVLFESKGLSKIVESRYYYVAIILALISFLILYFTHIHVLDLKDNQAGLLFLILFLLAAFIIKITRTIKKCEVKIYEDYIEVKTITFLEAAISRSETVRNKIIKFDEINGITSVENWGYIIIETMQEKNIVFCKSGKEIETMIRDKIKKEL